MNRQSLEKRFEDLKRTIQSYGRVLVAYSGGIDSAFLLKVSLDVLGRGNVLAFAGVSPTYPRTEREEAQRLAESIGAALVMVDSSEMEDENFLMNSSNRCYYCKTHLFTTAKGIAEREGYPYILEGSNVDDLDDVRPGRRACVEQDIKSPLLEAGLTKDEIRALSEKLGLPTSSKRSQACLSSRIPYGTPISIEVLKQIEASEIIIKNLGIKQVRVRYHGNIARIEVEVTDLARVLDCREEIAAELRKLGFTYVALDIEAYRTGSMNESALQERPVFGT
jgi:pyridinium-3,5-biscarboxylic acid mononucleotide sulfurtransferase